MAEVKVIIQDNLGGSETITKPTTNVGVKTTAKEIQAAAAINKESAAISAAGAKALTGAAVVGKQVVSYVTSNGGKWTGNSHNQVKINNATELVGYGMLALINPTAALTSLGFKVATSAMDNVWDQKWDNAASQRRLARAGFNSMGEAIGYRRNR